VIQVIRIPIDSQRYYMVDARTRQASDQVGTTNRLYDEGVQIEYVDESRATPMTQCAPPATGSCVKDPPGGRWPYNLWHVGQTFTDTSRNIAIRVVAIVGSPSDPGRGFTVTVSRGVPPGHPQRYHAQLAVQVLSGGMGARLFTEVREKRGLCYSVGAGNQAVAGHGYVVARAGTTTERSSESTACRRKAPSNRDSSLPLGRFSAIRGW